MRLASWQAFSHFAANRSDPNVRPAAVKLIQALCLQCGGSLSELVFTGFDTRFGIPGTYDVWRCSGCQLEQLFPVPSAQELKTLYETYYNFGAETGTRYTRLRERFFSSFLYRLWIRLDGDISYHLRKGRGRLIDIGCNEGRGLRIYQRNGFQVEGLELNETAAAQARARGYTVHTTFLAQQSSFPPFNVAVLSNVLEHASDPCQMLLDIGRILSPQGQVWISCPNNQSFLRNIFGKSWINWHLPFHISHFSPQTIKNALEQTGFTAVEIRNVTPSTWVAMSIIAAMFARQGQPTRQLRNPMLFAGLVLLVRILMFPILWFNNRIDKGDCLLVTAVKS